MSFLQDVLVFCRLTEKEFHTHALEGLVSKFIQPSSAFSFHFRKPLECILHNFSTFPLTVEFCCCFEIQAVRVSGETELNYIILGPPVPVARQQAIMSHFDIFKISKKIISNMKLNSCRISIPRPVAILISLLDYSRKKVLLCE